MKSLGWLVVVLSLALVQGLALLACVFVGGPTSESGNSKSGQAWRSSSRSLGWQPPLEQLAAAYEPQPPTHVLCSRPPAP